MHIYLYYFIPMVNPIAADTINPSQVQPQEIYCYRLLTNIGLPLVKLVQFHMSNKEVEMTTEMN